MPQLNKVLTLNKAALLVTTSLVLSGCNTVTQQSQSAEKSDPVVTDASSETSNRGLSQNKLMKVAARAWKQGNPGTALRMYNMAAQKNPNNPAPYLAMAEILRKTKRAEAAVDIYKGILKTKPDTLEAHRGIGYSLLTLNKPYLASQSFEAAIALDPQNAKSLGGMAVALDTAGEHEKAQDYYRHAIKADPNNLTYQNNLALSLALIGRTEQAIAMLEIITAHPKATAKHRQNLALVYGMAGKSADAMRYSRMDLNERDARNNALYFQALNDTPSSDIADHSTHSNAMIVAEKVKKESEEKAKEATTQLVARVETEQLNTGTGVSNQLDVTPKTQSKPSMQRPQRHPMQDYVRYAEAPRAAEAVIADAQIRDITSPNVAAAPVGAVTARDLKAPVIADVETAAPEVVAKVVQHEQINAQDLPDYLKAEAFTEFQTPVTISYPAPIQTVPVAAQQVPVTTVAFKMQKPAHSERQYFAQIGSFRTPERAQAGWEILKNRHGDLLSDFAPVIAKADLGPEKGIFYRVRVGGFDEKSIPLNLCVTLRERSEGCYMPLVSNSTPALATIAAVPPKISETRQADAVEVKETVPAVPAKKVPRKKGYKQIPDRYNIATISY